MNNLKNMRRGFTMIELIFVIVIIGILAAIALPRLAATRDDAKQVKAVNNLVTCISDIGSSYTGSGNEVSGGGTATNGSDSYSSCASVANDLCFTVGGVESATPDGNITVVDATLTELWCTQAQVQATAQLVSGGTAVTHEFGGSKVEF